MQPSAASRVLVVAHSYGASLTAGLLKAGEGRAARVAALALTDGWVSFGPSFLDETVPPL